MPLPVTADYSLPYQLYWCCHAPPPLVNASLPLLNEASHARVGATAFFGRQMAPLALWHSCLSRNPSALTSSIFSPAPPLLVLHALSVCRRVLHVVRGGLHGQGSRGIGRGESRL